MPDIPFALRLLLAALAVYRLARMISLEDGPLDIFVDFRTWVGVYDYSENGLPGSMAARLFSCPLCVGVWLAFPAMVMATFPVGDSFIIVIWLAIAGIQTFLQRISE